MANALGTTVAAAPPLPSNTPAPSTGVTSRDSFSRPGGRGPEAVVHANGQPERRIHSGVPSPEEDDMAPQNVSFIEESSGEDANVDVAAGEPLGDGSGELLRKLPERLSQLNISSGSKTYRVHSDKEPSPSPTRPSRPTISSTFKQQRRSSGEHGGGAVSGPSSLQAPSMTEEEAETLAMMKTERLKDDADAAKGFVISFDDEVPKKPKPQLKPRRPSVKRNGAASGGFASSEFSDGSNSSRKENVPPEVMICIVSLVQHTSSHYLDSPEDSF